MNDEEKYRKWFKESADQWLDSQKKRAYMSLGKWVVNLLIGLAIWGLVWLMLKSNGWQQITEIKGQ